MLSLYSQALFKRANLPALTQFRPPSLPQRIYSQSVAPRQEHYRRYCDVVGWHDSDQVHPCYLQVLALRLQLKCLLDKKSPFAAMGLIHIENAIEVHRTPDLAQPIDLRVRFKSVKQHRHGWLLTLEVQAFQDEKCIHEATSGYLARVHAAHVGLRQPENGGQHPLPAGDVAGELDADAGIGRRYARVAGDINPIHLSAVSARLFGFKSALAHGMWSLAAAASNIVDEQHNHSAKGVIEALSCSFHKPLLLPGSAEVRMDKATTPYGFTVARDDTLFISGKIGLTD
ncbi:MaoC/PaaZ C-terminal domain-containing protein [Alteromonas halophila]|uniref:MaoC-like domain-containing protein n=1 Tax=Alteromonas halophila TaxID=516698 RepID=A0A918MXX8_9ALTE|nr:MaoC/PaaZ C-terminal domain-containing protein [Alteromonas halophila]GGW86024.1 hypothetical protein GCM10007391_19570 [Alteromonas halophila]